ncbi:MAG: hypothetical protein OES21_03590 [Myxococcales bacterium]|nr:hypothetical protein [Myxococcales bacterium]
MTISTAHLGPQHEPDGRREHGSSFEGDCATALEDLATVCDEMHAAA